MRMTGLRVQATIPRDWVVHCKSVGSGNKALVYLGRSSCGCCYGLLHGNSQKLLQLVQLLLRVVLPALRRRDGDRRREGKRDQASASMYRNRSG
jgi:hypothetical protein